MGITMIALAGILLLGAGIAILVVNVGRTKSSTATIEQIGTYGYVAESAGGSEVGEARRPIDALAGRLGDFAAKRTSRSGEARIRDELISAGMYDTSPRKVLGYQLPPGLEGDLEALELPPRDARLACRTLLIDEGVGEGLDELGQAIERLGSRVECHRGECGRVWTREVGGEQASVPRELLGAIVDWVTRTDGP